MHLSSQEWENVDFARLPAGGGFGKIDDGAAVVPETIAAEQMQNGILQKRISAVCSTPVAGKAQVLEGFQVLDVDLKIPLSKQCLVLAISNELEVILVRGMGPFGKIHTR